MSAAIDSCVSRPITTASFYFAFFSIFYFSDSYAGIVFLATNRPFDLDEAMHRRITSVVEFKSPDHIQRKKIWQIMIQSNGVRVEEGIDWEQVALKYELSGGFIKNAVMSAMLRYAGLFDCAC